MARRLDMGKKLAMSLPSSILVRCSERDGKYIRTLVFVAVLASLFLSIGCRSSRTPVPTPEEASSVSFTTEDGVELKGKLFGKGDTGVVLAHMFQANQTSWWEFGQVLADEGYMALAFDFRGYDGSSGSKDINFIDRDIMAALEFLRHRGASSIFLIGASMGGTASLKVAASENVAGVVILSAPLDFRGLNVEKERVRVPALLMASDEDEPGIRNLQAAFEDGVVTKEISESAVYEGTREHGSDILHGKYGDVARARILDFLAANGG